MTKLSDSQRVILSAAAQHEMGLARAPKNLPAAARNAVFRSLIKNNLLTEINAPREHVGLGWRQDDDGTWIVARITDEGLRAIGIDPNEDDAVAAAPVADTAPTGGEDDAEGDTPAEEAEPSDAAPWDDEASRENDIIAALDGPMSALRHALAGKPPRAPRELGAPRKPREGTKQEAVLALLRRDKGATIAQICEATGWQQHTVRGFFAGLKKRQGIEVQVLERVRQVGPNKEGAKGSFTIYHLPA